MGGLIHTFKKCCPPGQEEPRSVYPRRSFFDKCKKNRGRTLPLVRCMYAVCIRSIFEPLKSLHDGPMEDH